MDAADHRAQAVRLYNLSWELLEQSDRTADDDVALLTAAFASRHHWSLAGGAEQAIIADWMVARASGATNYGSLAVDFAMRASIAANADDAPDWLLASTAEGVARAYAAAGDQPRREEWYGRASELVTAIVDPADRALIAEQLASVPR